MNYRSVVEYYNDVKKKIEPEYSKMVRRKSRKESSGNRTDLDVDKNVLEDILTSGPKKMVFKPVDLK